MSSAAVVIGAWSFNFIWSTYPETRLNSGFSTLNYTCIVIINSGAYKPVFSKSSEFGEANLSFVFAAIFFQKTPARELFVTWNLIGFWEYVF